ncbi:hypothetical protein HL653_12725 [Sphingomonas sp. AP4-R1]|uniref:hypothetical protein n=1 Tax=Sphingomonas sp. AP4-R1 TaxID=2735134 RepID=UPI0014934AF3|nr:hypothetical protein [Sphingomonas sp. AP4-R1]QJU58513.1 hypothetical protein HL653_12725 [Sphingomonas sp. AP4-R1]
MTARIGLLLAGVLCLCCEWAEAQALPPPVRTKIVVRWLDRQPTGLVVITDAGELDFPYDATGKLFSVELPEQKEVLGSWTLVARYGGAAVPIQLRVRRETPSLAFSLPRPEPTSCTKRAADRVSVAQDNVLDSLRLALEARYLLQIQTDGCDLSLKQRISEAWLARMNELVRRANYFEIGDDLRQQYLAVNASRQGARVALASSVRVSQGLQAKVAYEYQADAIKAGNLVAAASINDALIEQAAKDPALSAGLTEAKVDRLKRDRDLIKMAIEASPNPIGPGAVAAAVPKPPTS